MFNLGDRVVYPGHGVAEIMRIIKRIIGGQVTMFYELKFINKDMSILVPTAGTNNNTIRPLSSPSKINDVLNYLAEQKKESAHYNGHQKINKFSWKQRNKEYQSKLRTGTLQNISEIYRELKYIEQYKELSFCEKNLLQQTETLLAEEIALVRKLNEDKAIEYLRSFFHQTPPKSTLQQKTL